MKHLVVHVIWCEFYFNLLSCPFTPNHLFDNDPNLLNLKFDEKAGTKLKRQNVRRIWCEFSFCLLSYPATANIPSIHVYWQCKYLDICLSILWSIHLSAHLTVCPSAYLPICPSAARSYSKTIESQFFREKEEWSAQLSAQSDVNLASTSCLVLPL